MEFLKIVKNGILKKNEIIKTNNNNTYQLPTACTDDLTDFSERITKLSQVNKQMVAQRNPQNWIKLTIVIDESGSMAGTEEDVYQGLKELIEHHRSHNILLTIVGFGTAINTKYENVIISQASPILPNTNGLLTRLNDTIYQTSKIIETSYDPMTNLVVIISDGLDNGSEKKSEEIKQTMTKVQQNPNNRFYFLGEPDEDQSPQEVYTNAINLGFIPNNIAIFSRKNKGIKLNFDVINKMIDSWFQMGFIPENWKEPINNNYLLTTKQTEQKRIRLLP